MNYELTKKYFEAEPPKPPKPSYKTPIILGVIGLIFVFIVVVLGLIILAIAAGIAFIKFNSYKKALQECEDKKSKIPSDQQYDSEVATKLTGIRERALNALGVDEDEVSEIPPISFDGYIYKDANEFKIGKDGLYRTDKYESVVLFFSKNEVHCYTYRFDTTQDKKTDATDVYFYKDIVSVSTASDSVKLGEKSVDYEYFKLTTAGGTALSVSLRDTSNAQQSINAMRALLREKKQG